MAGERVLLVEDDRDLARATAVRLRAHGFQVSVATESGAAIDAVAREQPQLILLDLGLPGEDGLALLERLSAALDTRVPVIVVTAREASDYATCVGRWGIQEIMQKPTDAEQMLRAMRAALTPNPAS